MTRVLLIEDLDIVREDIKNIIDWKTEGFEIVGEASNGETGLKMFRALRPDIIITDIRMPVISGLDMIRTILSETKESDVGFVLLTAYEEFEYAKQALDMRINSYILKHELTPELILRELNRQRKLIQNARDSKAKSAISAIRSVLTDKTTDKNTLKEILPESDERRMLLIQIENSSRNIGYLDEISEIILKKMNNIMLGKNNLMIIDISTYELVVLYTKPQNISIAKDLEMENRFLRELQLDLKDSGFSTFISVYGKPVSFANIQSVYIKMHILSKKKVFEKDKKLIHIDNIQSDDSFSENQKKAIDEKLEKIKFTLSDRKFQDIPNIISGLFTVTLKEIGSYMLYERCVYDLIYLIGNIIDYEEKEYFMRITGEILKNPQNYSAYEISDLFCGFISKLSKKETGKYSKKVRRIISYIENHYYEDVNLSLLAEILKLSPVYLCRIFKHEVGITFKEYLTKVRMRTAVRLLQSGQYKVYEVSEKVGYQTVQYFCKVFKQETGKYPSDYINNEG